MRLIRLLSVLAITAGLALPAAAQECVGRNLLEALPPATLAELQATTRKVPYHHGLFWRAEKGDQRITLLGTYHFDDPRHQRTLAQFGPEIDAAGALLVEAGPEEEARLTEAMTKDPSLIMDATGPTLPERMTDEDWANLWHAMEARGVPAVITSRMRPWYVSVLLGVSPCMLETVKSTGDTGGLDHLLIQRAEAAGVRVQALEPWDTVFSLFDGMTPEEEIGMIRAAMPAAEYADDYAVTLTDAYFSGDSWLIWEFGRRDAYDNSGLTRAEVDEQVRFAQRTLMDERNSHWIAPLERAAREAAKDGKGIVAGFGALHLPGDRGVLSLLEHEGWKITPIKPQGGQGNGG
ncbi:MAG TPA: TraB/GumN family protein [Paracoccus sp. (in: a-proteobacteria)]|uniref:TraB/GumN family protein n=1 Tax=Paracoccus sp. TaxID=267 RepID=UPI002BB7D55F|nr:TraB/GumN family protein [Paracoccus sp. (in: a-proteobacteria)]HWL55717.1 TraB/GumN family protein [Paracoccus sp. (in: a-proteobacteria)]